MADARVCAECGKIYRVEGEWCEREEIVFEYKLYHFGEGMHSPWKKLRKGFCSQACFRNWFTHKAEADIKALTEKEKYG
jgi:hypothetical protein